MQHYVKIGKGLAKCAVGHLLTDTQVAIKLDRSEKRHYEDDEGEKRCGFLQVGAINMMVSKHRIVDDLPYGGLA